MKTVLTRQDESIVVFGDAERVEIGLLINNCIYPDYLELNAHEVPSIPEGIAPGTHSYSPASGFVANPNYKPPFDPEAEIARLKAENEMIKGALDELLMGGVV